MTTLVLSIVKFSDISIVLIMFCMCKCVVSPFFCISTPSLVKIIIKINNGHCYYYYSERSEARLYSRSIDIFRRRRQPEVGLKTSISREWCMGSLSDWQA